MRQIEQIYNSLTADEKRDFMKRKVSDEVPTVNRSAASLSNYPCKSCGATRPTKDGHDPCIANLQGVRNACCGHGGWGYVQFENGIIIRGFVEFPHPNHEGNRSL